MRIIVFIVSAAVHLCASAVGFFMLILGLNGFSGGEAEPGLLFYIIANVAAALGLGVVGALVAGRIAAKKSLGRFGAGAIAVAASFVVGMVLLATAFLAAVLIAQYMHGSR
jgi:hypothetical protein